MFGSSIQVLPSDIGEYFSSFFIAVVVVAFISIYILQLKNVLYQKESLLTYLLTYLLFFMQPFLTVYFPSN